MAENTRARSTERANLSEARPRGTTSEARPRGKTAASPPERATIDITSQFNFFFAELRFAVKRPDSLTVGIAGPSFDLISIFDDVNETHAALMSQADAVSIEEIERCLKIVTELSKMRKGNMLETITVAVNAERDAYVRAKLAEHDEAMRAMLHVRDEEYAARMRARDAENVAKLLSMLKLLKVKSFIPVLPLALQASTMEAQQIYLRMVSEPPAASSDRPSSRLILGWRRQSPYSSSAAP
jgi:hypothetical protein